MFSVIFPGQGSQMVGMGKEFYDKFDLVKNLFKEADDTLNFSMSKLILEGSERGVRLNGKYSTSNIFNQLFNL
jgi:[acyl-carrier-protein] S-malonyltransferase